MTLSCPSCKSRFMIDPAVLLPSGRKVRCGFCGERWFQEPLPEEDVTETAESAAEEPGQESPQPAAPREPDESRETAGVTREEGVETEAFGAGLTDAGAPAAVEDTAGAGYDTPEEEPARDIQAAARADEFSDEGGDSVAEGLPETAAGSDLEEPWQDDSLAAVVADGLPDEALDGPEVTETQAEEAKGLKAAVSEPEAESPPTDLADVADDGESLYGDAATDDDDSDWDSDWRGTQPLAEDRLAEEGLDEEGTDGEDRYGAETEEALGAEGVTAPAQPGKAPDVAARAADSADEDTVPDFDAAEALFEETEESDLGIYGDQDEVQHWDDLEKAAESDVVATAPVEEPLSAPPAMESQPEEEAVAQDSGETPYGESEDELEPDDSVLADLGIEASPVTGEARAEEAAAPESSLFAKKGTSRATILSPDEQEPQANGTSAEAEMEQGTETEVPTAESSEAEPPVGEIGSAGEEQTVYFDAEKETAEKPESFDPGRALEEVAETPAEDLAEQPTKIVEGKPVKTMSDYLVAAVDDDDIQDREEEWGVSELESFFREESKRETEPGAEPPAAERSAAAPLEASDEAVAAPEPESDIPQASESARSKFRRIMAAGATAAAAQEASDEAEAAEKEEVAEELVAAEAAKPARGGGSLARGWTLYFATLLALGSVFYFGRGRLVDFEPRMAELYKLIGM